MFYYLLHIYLIHPSRARHCRAHGAQRRVPLRAPFFAPPAAGWGFGLPAVYGFWALTILILFHLCRWFAGVKSRRKDPWPQLSLTHPLLIRPRFHSIINHALSPLPCCLVGTISIFFALTRTSDAVTLDRS